MSDLIDRTADWPAGTQQHAWVNDNGNRWDPESPNDDCGVCGHTPDVHISDREADERAALAAGTHEPAVDDFGHQYLALIDAAPAVESLTVRPGLTFVLPADFTAGEAKEVILAAIDHPALTETEPKP